MRRAEILDSVKDPTGVNHAKAAAMREQAQLALNDRYLPRSRRRNAAAIMLTNETMYKGPPRSGTTIDAGGMLWALPSRPETVYFSTDRSDRGYRGWVRPPKRKVPR